MKNYRHLCFWDSSFRVRLFSFASWAVYLNTLIKQSFCKVPDGVLFTSPICSIASLKKSDSDSALISVITVCCGVTGSSQTVMAYANLTLSITIDLVVPRILKLVLKSSSPSARALKAVNSSIFYSSILVAIAYSITSQSGEPDSNFDSNSYTTDLVLISSSIYTASFAYLR